MQQRFLTTTFFGAFALVLVCLPFAGCSKSISDKDIVKLTVAQARDYVVNPPTNSIFETPVAGIWIDPRREPDYVLGHIPGAINIPFGSVSNQWTYLEGYGPKIVYGDTFNDPLADAMSKTLMEYGLTDIYTLRGGIEAWTEADLKLEKGASPKIEDQRPARRNPIRH